MRIAIDASALMKPARTGVARYVLNLIRALAREATDEEFLLCYRYSRYSRRKYRIPPPTARFRSVWFQGPVYPHGVDVTHGPDGRLMSFRGARSLATVHDVFSLESDHFATAKFRKKKARRYAEIARRAERIVCVSSWTRDTFWRHMPVSEDRFVVIPEGVEERFRPSAGQWVGAIRARYSIHGPYVAFVGQLSIRKNVTGMLDAFQDMPMGGPRLVLAGAPAYGHRDLAEDVRRRGMQDRVILTGYFPDSELPALLAGAECLLFPSHMEGFGLPALEAMACGTPVVCSNRGALEETTAGIAVQVDPDDPGSIRAGVERLLGDSTLHSDLSRRGLEWAGHHRWPRVARLMLALYRELGD